MAEMMMVMAIIGATAALTIPNLVDSYKEEQTIVKLKKAQEDLNRAYKSMVNKYGEQETWNSAIFDSPWENYKRNDRLTEFLKGTPIDLPGSNYYSEFELDDGTILSINVQPTFIWVYVTTSGIKGNVDGKDTFLFINYRPSDVPSCPEGTNLNYPIGIFVPSGYCEDRNTDTNAFTGSGSSTSNWAVFNGNLDYLKCNDLNWETKTTCD